MRYLFIITGSLLLAMTVYCKYRVYCACVTSLSSLEAFSSLWICTVGMVCTAHALPFDHHWKPSPRYECVLWVYSILHMRYLMIITGSLFLAMNVYCKYGVWAAAVLVHVVGPDGSVLQTLLVKNSAGFVRQKKRRKRMTPFAELMVPPSSSFFV
jgi:hypothetical protein